VLPLQLSSPQATQNAERLATTFNFAGYFKHPSNFILMCYGFLDNIFICPRQLELEISKS
jgi:hypothetical protein